jgi:hypothetical protein
MMPTVLTTRTLFIATSVLGLVFGLGFLLVPHLLIGLFGTTVNDGGEVSARLYGKALLALATIAWLGRDLRGDGARAIAGGALVNFVLAAVISVWSFAAGITNALALVNAAAFAVLAFAFALLLFRRSDAGAGTGVGEQT